MLESREQSSRAQPVKLEAALQGLDLDLHSTTSISTRKNKRRFSDEQIKSLEFLFETKSRPEPQIKQQLANELGLQPRQVAIWFQNKRARSKTKQLEQDYSMLKASYDNLASNFESIKREKQSLSIQLHKLKNLLEKPHGNKTCVLNQNGNNSDGKYKDGDTMSEPKQSLGFLLEGYDNKTNVPSSDNDSRNADSIKEYATALNMVEAKDCSFSSSRNWCNFEPSCFLEESSCTSQWWGVWP